MLLATHRHIHRRPTAVMDASADPSGTAPLERRMRAEADAKWRRVKVLVLEALGDADVLGLRGPTVRSVSHAATNPQLHPLPGGDKLAAFRQWLTEAIRQAVMPNDAMWTVPFVQQAAKMARDRAAKLTGVIPPASKRADIMATTIKGELKGIADATVQRASRALAHGLLTHQRPAKIAREVGSVIDAIGKTRTGQMANYAIMKTFSTVTLESYRAAGITHVGTIPEKIKVKRSRHGNIQRIKDAARKTPQKRHGRTGKFVPFAEPLTAAEQQTIERREAKVQALIEVDVLNADDPCPICIEISADGPYSIDEAEGLIPAHPNCLCVFVPSADLRFAPVRDE